MRRNAIILAAGTSSRFVPLSFEKPKGLLEVKGEVLIERQIRQLKEAGIDDICIVVGYKAEMFCYLKDKFGVDIIVNEDFARYNNTSSMMRILDRLGNTFICSSDNYFLDNVFSSSSEESFYSACFAHGKTKEYCLSIDNTDHIRNVIIGGADSWYMIGHAYFSEDFSSKFKNILEREYSKEETRHQYWEDIYIKFINQLPLMKINRYPEDEIKEFDSIDELRKFDHTYIDDTKSSVLKKIAKRLNCAESSLSGFSQIPNKSESLMFYFKRGDDGFIYDSAHESLTKV